MKAKEIFFYSLGALIVIGFFGVLLGLMIIGKSEQTINLALGALIAGFSTVVGYFYGSSASSARKDDIISNMNKP